MVKQTEKIEHSLLYLTIVSFLVLVASIIHGKNFHLDSELLNKAEQKYGKSARSRLVAWENLIISNNNQDDLEKLEKVNQFFNQMEFVDDIVHWKEKDYWATPIEFLGTQGGDCEDFTIAKYFTLKAMGIQDEKLNLTYVNALAYNQHHMVLAYYSSPGSEPLILDNIVKIIKPSSQRKDLLPIYSFNGTGLWLAKQRGKGKLAGSSSRLKRWQDLVQRMSMDNLGK
ncbi:transglutaminase-like cysteine peptidase [Thermodesulfobacteriota bacterium]